MNKTPRTNESLIIRFDQKMRRIAAFIFGDKTKAYFKFTDYIFVIVIFATEFKLGIKKSGNFGFKSFFFAVKNGLKELESCGVFNWLHKRFSWFDLG